MSRKIKSKTKTKTKKQEVRLEDNKLRKNDDLILVQYKSEYEKNSPDELIDISKQILLELEDDSIRDKHELELRYEALGNIMELKLIDSYKYVGKKMGYPDYEDPDFNIKISSKKEFNINKIPPIPIMSTPKDRDNYSKKLCGKPISSNTNPKESPSNPKEFNLTSNQKFLKTFMSPDTPYNSMLLFHGTGVGKTCTSISIAEQYSEELKKYNKKIIILLNPSIEENFKKNIFNIQKINENQCTGSKYLDEIKLENYDNISLVESKINKIIKGRYEFYGYQKFANIIENLQNKIKERYDASEYNRIFKRKIKEMFSNTVMIIDEVHNIKENDGLKVLPPLLEKVVKYADNMKLLLLSATPMFDTSPEIVFLINLMLRNDNRPIIHASDYFDNGNLIKENEDKFVRKIRGYISYMRGEDPYRFPKRLYPSKRSDNIIDDMPTTDKNGDIIDEELRINHLKIVGCEMQDYQLAIYNKMDIEKYGAFNQPGIMCSNIVFPKKDIDPTDEQHKLGEFISNDGFNNIVNTTKIGKNIKYTMKHDEYKDFFKLENLKNYATKLVKICENIEKSDGIVFVYSQFLNSGVISLALALEYMGYSKYGGSLINESVKQKSSQYIIISGNNDLSSNAYADYMKIQESNKNGEKIKIILGSQTAAEGLDFSYIRSVHVLEPWFHLNKLDQVIGRAIRNCSHINLDPKDREVKIYLYASIKSKNPKDDNETIDLETYRKAENKSKQMASIEYLLKKSSVDCYLNMNGNIFDEEFEEADMTKKCHYQKCKYDCVDKYNTKINTINNDTLLMNKYIKDNINEVKNIIKKMYKENYYYTLDDFIKHIGVTSKLLVFFALNEIIKNNEKIIARNNSNGIIIYKQGYYIFVKKKSSKFLTINNIRSKSKPRINTLNISRNNVLKLFSKNNSKKTIIPTKKTSTNSIEKITASAIPILIKFKKLNDVINRPFITRESNLKIKTLLNKIALNLVRYYIDFMSIKDKEILIKYLIFKSIKNNLTPDEKLIQTNNDNIMYYKSDVYFKDSNYKGVEQIWGYKTIVNKKLEYKKYDYETNTFIVPSTEEIKNIQKSFKKKEKLQPPRANIIGYYELKIPQNVLVFKIREKTIEGSRGSQIKTGSVCFSDGMKIYKIINFINELSGEIIYDSDTSVSKESLCKHLEILLRYKNLNKSFNTGEPKYRYFYGPEETIEYNLNAKKFK
jgi:hypothetical protein